MFLPLLVLAARAASIAPAAANMFLIGRAASPTNETLTSGSLLPDGEWGYYQLTATGVRLMQGCQSSGIPSTTTAAGQCSSWHAAAAAE